MRHNLIHGITCTLLLLPIIANGSCQTDSTAQEYPLIKARIEKASKQLMRRYHLPALAITLVDDQEIIYQNARGLIDIENNIDASTESVFKLWSVAKAFTALEIFREIEEGQIDLDAPLTTYLPEFSIQSRFEGRDSITVRDLLAHRAGLPRNEGLLPEERDKDLSFLEKFEKGASSCYLAYPVSYRYKYSNLGYDLLGRIIELTRHMGYYQYMKEHILDELGMESSNFYREGIADSLQIALGYEYHKRNYYPYIQYNINNVPSGNLYSTIEDLSSFLKAIFRNQLFEKTATLTEMFVDHYSNPQDPQTMGLGWKTVRTESDELVIWHDGGPTEGIGSLVAFLPDKKIGIALVGNGTTLSGAYSMPIAMDILNCLLEERQGITMLNTEKSRMDKAENDNLQAFEGKYVAFGDIMEVKAKKNKLKTRISGFRLNLIPIEGEEFAVTNWMDKIGLTKFARLPMDLSQIKIRFMKTGVVDSSIMILNFGNISHEICPKYPNNLGLPERWNSLEGEYNVAELLPGNSIGKITDRSVQITMDEGVLKMSGIYGPIIPVDDKYLKIVGGPFHGETMEYNNETGHIIHQKTIFIHE